MKIKHRTAGENLVLKVETESLNFSEAGILRQAVSELVDKMSPESVIIDFSGVEFIDSLGIGALASLSVRLKKEGRNLRVAGVSSIVKTALAASRMEEIIGFYKNVGEACGEEPEIIE